MQGIGLNVSLERLSVKQLAVSMLKFDACSVVIYNYR